MVDREIAQKYFSIACKFYKDSEETIKELTFYVQQALPKCSFVETMVQYDLILQTILLCTAIDDGYFLNEERQFIEKLTHYGDIMKTFTKCGMSISWDTFEDYSNDEQKTLSLKMIAELVKLAESFVMPFAIVDTFTTKDYCKTLTKQMIAICVCLAQCDGDSDKSSDYQSEMSVALTLINELVTKKWREFEARSNDLKAQNKNE